MKTSLLLRIASVLTLLFAIGHTMGGLDSWSPQGETAVLNEMKSFHFDIFGVSRTYWDFYIGFGLFNSVGLLLQAVVLWQLAGIAKQDASRIRPLLGSFITASLAFAILAWKFIFAIPVAFSVAIAVCLIVALLTSRKVHP
jgi:hypothetical protein